MKLISCYIESYGAIKKQSVSFDRGITTICERNGYGKTTLASFLETMFYGMETDRANSKGLPTRKHYLPFDGGRFGGNVVFTCGGDTYKIERYFDEKSEVKDSLTVYKNNNVTQIFGTQVGEKLFGIDRQSFERTIFISAGEIEIGSTGSINAKLGAVVEGGDDSNTEKAIKRLEKAAGEYQKSRGDSGLISRENSNIFNLNKRIDNLKAIKNSLPEKYQRLADCESKLKGMQNTLDDAQQGGIVLKDWEQYDSLINSAEECKRAMTAAEQKYPLGLPSADELQAIREAVSAAKALEKQTENFLSPQDSAALERLDKKYGGGIPTEKDISEAAKKAVRISSLNAEIRAEESGAPSPRESDLCARFAGNVPIKSALDSIEAAVSEYRAAEKAYAETPDYVIEKAARQKTDGRKYVAIAIIFAIVAAAGLGVLTLSLTAGIAVIAVGVIGLAVGGFLYLNNKTANAAAETIQKINPEKAAAERAKNNAELKIRQLLAPYEYASENNVYFLVESFKNDFADYGKLMQTDGEKRARIADSRAKRDNLQKELTNFFATLGLEGDDFNGLLAELQDELGLYNSLARTRDKLLEQNHMALKEIEKQDGVIKNFRRKYGFDDAATGENIARIESDVAEYARSEANYEAYCQKAESFRIEKALTSRPEAFGEENLQQLKSGIDELNASRSALLTEINDCETEAEKIDALAAEKEQSEQTLKKYRKDYEILCRAKELLSTAETQLKDKYISPIKTNFLKYARLIESALGEKVTISSNFEIRFERGGAERSEKYLSAGQLSICAFCFRAALIDNMYKDEKPFLILDDPFVNLDENHLQKVKRMLKELSEEMQIVYFTCHESRAV